MHTAYLQKNASPPASGLLAQLLRSLSAFDSAAARQLRDGTITHLGRHHELLSTVPEYRELLAQDADLDHEEALR